MTAWLREFAYEQYPEGAAYDFKLGDYLGHVSGIIGKLPRRAYLLAP